MASLFDQVRCAVKEDRYLFSVHADERLRERAIPSWQVVAGPDEARLIVQRTKAKPNPVVEVEHELPDGTTVKAVWVYLPSSRTAKLVTVHFINR